MATSKYPILAWRILCIGHMTQLVSQFSQAHKKTETPIRFIDYDQQRRALLKRHGIDLEEPTKTKMRTLKRREVEALLGQEWLDQGQGMLTWRDNRRRKMAFSICGYVMRC